jgi:exonuclease VII large subunit
MICIIGSFLGITSLYFISFLLTAEDIEIDEIGRDYIGRRVALSGNISDFRVHRNGHLFFTILDNTGSLDVVIWEDRVEQLELSGINLNNLESSSEVRIIGNVEIYRGDMLIVI